MGDKSKIEWTDATWNPMVGCGLVSPGYRAGSFVKADGLMVLRSALAQVGELDAAQGREDLPHCRTQLPFGPRRWLRMESSLDDPERLSLHATAMASRSLAQPKL